MTKFDSGLARHEYLYLLEKSINEEFEYNTSQQNYITANSCQDTVSSKNAILKMLHDTYESLGENADLSDFKTVFLMNYMNGPDFISENIDALRGEVLLVT